MSSDESNAPTWREIYNYGREEGEDRFTSALAACIVWYAARTVDWQVPAPEDSQVKGIE